MTSTHKDFSRFCRNGGQHMVAGWRMMLRGCWHPKIEYKQCRLCKAFLTDTVICLANDINKLKMSEVDKLAELVKKHS